MNRLHALVLRWQRELTIASVSAVFIRVIYLTLLWMIVKQLPVANVVWGTDYLTLLYNPFDGIDRWAMLLNETQSRPYYWFFLLPYIVLLLAGIAGLGNWFTRALLAYLFVALHYGNVETSSGGHHLFQQLLFFHIFLFKLPEEHGRIYALGRLLHNVAFYAIWIQIALMYFVSGYWKLKGDMWLGGEAVLMSLSFKEFGFPVIAEKLTGNTWYLQLATYFSLSYQVLFAGMIWIAAIRKYWLALGLAFHMSIALVVGITDFGIMMAASYSIFLQPAVAMNIEDKLWRLSLKVPRRKP